jgi:hypothetical protein
VTGNLPDSPATWVELRQDQLLVGTDVGAFASQPGGAYADAATFAPLEDLPNVPVSSISLKPGDPNTAVIAAFGRGVWTYAFDEKVPVPVEPPPTPEPEIGQAYSSYDFETGAQGWTTSGVPTWQRGTRSARWLGVRRGRRSRLPRQHGRVGDLTGDHRRCG